MNEASFGQWLRERRRALDLTQDDLALRVGLSRVTIRKLEAGERRPSRQLAERIAQVLDIAPADRAAMIAFARTAAAAQASHHAVHSTSTRHADTDRGWVPADPAAGLVHGGRRRTRTPLPWPSTPLIGREVEARTVRRRLLRDDTRLLTLTGAGGIGKSRLALHVASSLVELFDDGVVFVPLAMVTDPALVPQAIAQALDLQESSGQQLIETLVETLYEQQMLLVLDNFEQVLSAARFVAELLERCPWIKILITSRATLHLRGERQYTVPGLALTPLATPSESEDEAPEGVSISPAMLMFLERARAVRPDFRLTEDSSKVVAEICMRLDGLPLAIELVAARTKILTPQAMLQRMTSGLQLLTGGSRDLPLRHQTLRGAFEWSYNLLSAPEQQLFRRLAVFADGWTFAAAEQVAGDLDQPAGRQRIPPLLDLLESLVDKSLIRYTDQHEAHLSEGGRHSRVSTATLEPRFWMLATVRDYAMELLNASGERDRMQQRHARCYVALAEAAEQKLEGPEQADWLQLLAVENSNLRTALHWSRTATDDPHTPVMDRTGVIGLRLAGALWRFWNARGMPSEGRTWLEGALTATAGQSGDGTGVYRQVRAKALLRAGEGATDQGEYIIANNFYTESLGLFEVIGDRRGMAFAMVSAGRALRWQGDYGRTMALLDASLAIFRELEDPWRIAFTLLSLGDAALDQGDTLAASGHLQEALTIYRGLSDTVGSGWALINLGRVARASGDDAAAEAYFDESLRLFRALDYEGGVVEVLYEQGRVFHARGAYEQAAQAYRESLLLSRERGWKVGISQNLAAMGGVFGARGIPETGAQLLGASDALRAAVAAPLPPVAHAEHERDRQRVREQLDDAAWQASYNTGRALPLEEALTLVLEREL